MHNTKETNKKTKLCNNLLWSAQSNRLGWNEKEKETKESTTC